MQLQIKVINLFSSFTLVTLLLLTIPIIITSSDNYKTANYPLYVKTTISCAFITSIIPTIIFIHTGQEIIISNWHWLTIQTVKLSLSFKIVYFSIIFVPVALFVTWSIIEFSMWYIHLDPNINQFLKYVLLFPITILILVTTNNLFQLFIGWEGVGIISFLLIGWWYGRADANIAALQAILYNRIGDIGFILAIAWFLINLNAWDFQQIFILNPNNSNIPLIGLALAATGKSAQFGLHPWLPSNNRRPYSRLSTTPLKHNSSSGHLPTNSLSSTDREQQICTVHLIMPRSYYHSIYSNMCPYPKRYQKNCCFFYIQSTRPYNSNNWH